MTINVSPATRALTSEERNIFDKPTESRFIARAKFEFFRRAGGVVACYDPGASADMPRAFYKGERFGHRIPATAAEWLAHKSRVAARRAATAAHATA